MITRWEYLLLAFVSEVDPGPTLGAPKTTRSEYRITRPGEPKPEVRTVGVDFLEIINELGLEGWELATESTFETVIGQSVNGWAEAGIPTLFRWTFKRPLN